MLMYKRKLRSHFLSHLYAVMHDARPSLFYLCGLVCGLAELEQNSSYAVALYAWRSSVAIYLAVLSAVLRSGFRDTGQRVGLSASCLVSELTVSELVCELNVCEAAFSRSRTYSDGICIKLAVLTRCPLSGVRNVFTGPQRWQLCRSCNHHGHAHHKRHVHQTT